jgi:ABC-type amino acid transport substrate-binding protein
MVDWLVGRHVRTRRRLAAAVTALLTPALPAVLSAVVPAVLLAGCGLGQPFFPADPGGTLQRVREQHVVRAGAAPNPGWVEIDDSGRPSGREMQLVEAYAETLGAEVEWTVGTEEHLVGLLEDGKLDVAVGGFTDQNPWVEKVALTRPYVEEVVDGTPEAHVLALPMGENAWLSSWERWLDRHGEAS